MFETTKVLNAIIKAQGELIKTMEKLAEKDNEIQRLQQILIDKLKEQIAGV